MKNDNINKDNVNITECYINHLKISYEQQINFLKSQISFYKWVVRILFIILFFVSFFQIFSYL